MDRFDGLKSMAGGLSGAARRGWDLARKARPTDLWLSAMRDRLRPGLGGYCDLGLSPSNLAAAFGLTLGFYLVVNSWLASRIDRAYREHRATEMARADGTSAAVDRLIQEGVAVPRLRGWLHAHLDPRLPAPELVERLFRSVATAEGDALADRPALLTRMATGSRAIVWPFGYGYAELATPTAAYRGLSEVEPHWPARLAAAEGSKEKQAVLLWAVTDLLKATESPLRDYLRLNGWVQWLTVLIAFLVAVLGGRRAQLIRRVRSRWAGGIPIVPGTGDAELVAMAALLISNQEAGASRAELTMLLQEESGRLAEGVEDRVYGTLSFLLGCLPSLGFIGTILGMGEALLRANGLLNAADREQTISQMTQQLGFAFDTTLVALLAGLIVGGGIAWVHQVERRWLQYVENILIARVLPAARPTDEGVLDEPSPPKTAPPDGHATAGLGTDGGRP